MDLKNLMLPQPTFLMESTTANQIVTAIPQGNYAGLCLTFKGVHSGSIARADLTQKVSLNLNGEIISETLVKHLIAIDNFMFGYGTETVGTTFKYYAVLPTAFRVEEKDKCQVIVSSILAGSTSNANKIETLQASNLIPSLHFASFNENLNGKRNYHFTNISGLYLAPATEATVTNVALVDTNSKVEIVSSTFESLKDACLEFANVESTEVGLLLTFNTPKSVKLTMTTSGDINIHYVALSHGGIVSPVPPALPPYSQKENQLR